MATYTLKIVDGIPTASTSSFNYYDEYVTLGAPITSGTNITLPASGTYTGDDLEVYLNNIRQTDVLDYTWQGSPPRTQIQFTRDLVIGDILRYRKVY